VKPARQFPALTARAAGQCARLHKASFAFPWSVADFERLLTDSAVIADGIAGESGLSGFVLSRTVGGEGEILSIAVDPAERSAGLATSLLGHHLSRLSRSGVTALFLEVDESNLPALALYRRYGFVEVGKRPAYYARPDGSRGTASILRCNL
jgi:[ribosomal protein S18]-alanine N-acetyltransferase